MGRELVSLAAGPVVMMVLVDTTVWIDFFRGQSVGHVVKLESLIQEGHDICICGIILAEVLQGIRSESEYKRTKILFENLVMLPMETAVFIRSAEMYRTLRKKGITIRKSVDFMIAAVAMENDVPLLHNDKDFEPIEKHFGLQHV